MFNVQFKLLKTFHYYVYVVTVERPFPVEVVYMSMCYGMAGYFCESGGFLLTFNFF